MGGVSRRQIVHLIIGIFAVGLFIGGGIAISLLQNRAPRNPGFSVFSLDELFTPRPLIGVMIENEYFSRPFQKGLSYAKRVYEAPTEGNIPRFLAIFEPDKIPEKVGPVRSARSYFIDWMTEWKGLYVHVGGSDDAVRRLAHEGSIQNVDQFFYENYFWRENVGKVALEHTMFTGGDALRKLMAEKKWIRPVEEIPSRSENSLTDEVLTSFELARKITVDFGFPMYRVSYEYDPVQKLYMRNLAGTPHIDFLTEKPLTAKAVVVQRVVSRALGDEKGRISITTVGSGDATVFLEGRAIPATWEKSAPGEPTEFFLKNDGPIPLPASSVWIEILPLQNSFRYEAAAPPTSPSEAEKPQARQTPPK